MILCKACSHHHSPRVRCEVARGWRERGLMRSAPGPESDETVTRGVENPGLRPENTAAVTEPSRERPKREPRQREVTLPSPPADGVTLAGAAVELATSCAAAAGLALADWLDRAIRAYAGVAVGSAKTGAERQRAYIERKRRAAAQGVSNGPG